MAAEAAHIGLGVRRAVEVGMGSRHGNPGRSYPHPWPRPWRDRKSWLHRRRRRRALCPAHGNLRRSRHSCRASRRSWYGGCWRIPWRHPYGRSRRSQNPRTGWNRPAPQEPRPACRLWPEQPLPPPSTAACPATAGNIHAVPNVSPEPQTEANAQLAYLCASSTTFGALAARSLAVSAVSPAFISPERLVGPVSAGLPRQERALCGASPYRLHATSNPS